MSHTIRSQYDLIVVNEGLESDFHAMLDWLENWDMKPCNSVYFGEEVNAILVRNWIVFRNSLSNENGRYEREFLEACAKDECEPDDFYEIEDCLSEITDGQLMALARIFYPNDESHRKALTVSEDPLTEIKVSWHIMDVQNIRPDLTNEQASEVLALADRRHDAEVGINWDVLRIHADTLYPEDDNSSDKAAIDSRYADSIIGGNPQLYDALEIHGVRNLNDEDDPDGTHYEVDDENPVLFSVYVHCVAGGIECIGDFSTHELATSYANEISATYNWAVLHSSHDSTWNSDQRAEILRQLRGKDPSQFVVVDWDLIESIELLAECSGELACIFNDSYENIEEAALSGAVYFASQPVCNRGELEGALLGVEVARKAAGSDVTLYFTSHK